MAGEIVTAIQGAVAKNPEKALEVVQQMQANFASLSPEEKEQVIAALKELRSRAENLTPEQKKQIADAINGLG